MLVDDDDINNMLNRQFLNFCIPKADIKVFQDPIGLIELLRNQKIQQPDLILLNINMPEMDGWDFLEQMDHYNMDIHVMILSSSTHWDDVERAKNYSRVLCYIEKPLTEEKIKQFIQEQNFSNIELDRY